MEQKIEAQFSSSRKKVPLQAYRYQAQIGIVHLCHLLNPPFLLPSCAQVLQLIRLRVCSAH